MSAQGVRREVERIMKLSQELLAKKDKLCAEHYPKCITEDNADFKGGGVDAAEYKKRPAERQFRQGR